MAFVTDELQEVIDKIQSGELNGQSGLNKLADVLSRYNAEMMIRMEQNQKNQVKNDETLNEIKVIQEEIEEEIDDIKACEIAGMVALKFIHDHGLNDQYQKYLDSELTSLSRRSEFHIVN